jgi:hypothetical protein
VFVFEFKVAILKGEKAKNNFDSILVLTSFYRKRNAEVIYAPFQTSLAADGLEKKHRSHLGTF